MDSPQAPCVHQGDAIAQHEAPLLGLDAGFCRRYLQTIIHFELGPRERAGLQHFVELARNLDLARRDVDLTVYDREELKIAT